MTRATAGELFWWVILPYLALAIFVIGHIWRWRYDQFGWTSRSTQLQERRLLRWGGPLFHYGTFAAIAGHGIGILIPASWAEAVGISEHTYHRFASGAGTVAAALVVAGVVVLAGRRLVVRRVRATTDVVDWVALVLLLVGILTGVAPTLLSLVNEHDYRTTVAPWFRSIFIGRPDVQAITHAPPIFQVHATVAWVVLAVWPFSRLVHAWSAPLFYLWRPYIVYRSRRARRPSEPGTSGRRWRNIGAPY